MALPTEMLLSIFSHLVGRDLYRCRAVCRSWRAAIDGLSEGAWEEICLRQSHLGDYAAARKKYGLSWRDTYIALNSWSGVRSAEMKTRMLNISAHGLKVLPNGIVALNICRMAPDSTSFTDTIVYYDLETYEEIARDEFDFRFSARQFEINEHFIVVMVKSNINNKLCIILRENKNQFYVGMTNGFTVIDKEVYFKDVLDCIHVSKFVEEGGEVLIKTELLGILKDDFGFPISAIGAGPTVDIVSFANKGGNIAVLTYYFKIFVLNKEKKVFEFSKLWNSEDTHGFKTLENYGFDWKSPQLQKWLISMKASDEENFLFPLKPFVHACFGTGILVTVLTRFFTKGKILLSKCPLGMGDLSSILQCEPMRSIGGIEQTKIDRVNVMETTGSHKILFLGERGLFIYELVYKANDEDQHLTMEKRKLQSTRVVSKKCKNDDIKSMCLEK